MFVSLLPFQVLIIQAIVIVFYIYVDRTTEKVIGYFNIIKYIFLVTKSALTQTKSRKK